MLNGSRTAVSNTEEVGAVSHRKVAIGRVLVADEAQAVASDGHGGVLADLICGVRGVRVAEVQLRLAQWATLRLRLVIST